MYAPSFSSLEPLEQRIAPAGLITVTFAQGILTLHGADGADHTVEIVKTGTDTFRVEGTGTAINHAGKTFQNYRGALTEVIIEGGSGADHFALTKLSPLQNLTFEGQGGVDSLTTTNLKTRLQGSVSINLGAQGGSVDFSGGRTALQGPLDINLGDGGAVGFHSLLTTVNGRVVIQGGAGTDAVSIDGETTIFKGLSFRGGDGDDSFTSSGSALKILNETNMKGGAGTDHFSFGADLNKFGTKFTAGPVNLGLGVGTGTVTFLGDQTRILGTLEVDLGTGGGHAELKSATTTIRDQVRVFGGIGNDTLELAGRTNFGKTLTFLGGAGDDGFSATGGLLAVAGDTTVNAGTGASIFAINVVELALSGLSVTGGTSNDAVSISADGTIAGNVSLQLGADGTGPSTTSLESRAGVANGLKITGTLTVNMTGDTVDVLSLTNLQVAQAVALQTGANVSTVNIARLDAQANFQLHTGAGADVVNLDNIKAQDFSVDTEAGADELRIERNATFTGLSQVRGIATILTGIGADQIRIGNDSDSANLKVSFLGAVTVDAGDGANMRNDILGSNSFVEAPTITATGGTLTETTAV